MNVLDGLDYELFKIVSQHCPWYNIIIQIYIGWQDWSLVTAWQSYIILDKRWLRWHCPPDTGFEIRALAVWGRARYLSVTEAPHNTNFHTWMGKKQFCFFQTAETGNRTPDSGVKGSGANHYPRAPAFKVCEITEIRLIWDQTFANLDV